ncbi:phosphoglucosamine mutase [Orenia marismortui]|uniref:Phosphoglucosamine mutase n=1 Tax=Orenia marismortui TaxID=46469 RepID=A0A4R8GXR5_9FIRM|nr:phosphoglucosamine mutase [Orenia marismortui]TDX50944.1 phosphoglucosamine mutase [Orenia marismortui]
MGDLFGTDGVRGEANQYLTAELAFKIAKAGSYYLSQKEESPKILIGKDTRQSGDMLEAALIAGITSLGIDVVKVGVVPTPAVAYLTKTKDVNAGIMISASHNPVEDNGIKFFNKDGFKLSDDQEEEIEDIIFDSLDKISLPSGDKVGKVKFIHDGLADYINHIKSTVDNNFSGLKVVVDCANGAAFKAAPQVLEELGAEVIAIHNNPTGLNINVNCGSTNPEVIKKAVLNYEADLGIAHDGDADRLIAVDEKGNLVDGDYILAICGRQLIRERRLTDNTIVATKYSNLGLHQVMNELNGQVSVVNNGDRYVLAEMKEKNYILGGEKSGHIIFLDYNTTGDGILTALQLIDIIKKTGKNLSELRQEMIAFPQLLVNIEVEDKNWESNKNIDSILKESEKVLGDNGRIFVRASGTEPLIRVMVEGEGEEEIEELANNVAKVIRTELN